MEITPYTGYAQYTPINTYDPIPFEELAIAGAMKQGQYDKGQKAIEDQLAFLNKVRGIPTSKDAERISQYNTKFVDLQGRYSNMDIGDPLIQAQLKKDISTTFPIQDLQDINESRQMWDLNEKLKREKGFVRNDYLEAYNPYQGWDSSGGNIYTHQSQSEMDYDAAIKAAFGLKDSDFGSADANATGKAIGITPAGLQQGQRYTGTTPKMISNVLSNEKGIYDFSQSTAGIQLLQSAALQRNRIESPSDFDDYYSNTKEGIARRIKDTKEILNEKMFHWLNVNVEGSPTTSVSGTPDQVVVSPDYLSSAIVEAGTDLQNQYKDLNTFNGYTTIPSDSYQAMLELEEGKVKDADGTERSVLLYNVGAGDKTTTIEFSKKNDPNWVKTRRVFELYEDRNQQLDDRDKTALGYAKNRRLLENGSSAKVHVTSPTSPTTGAWSTKEYTYTFNDLLGAPEEAKAGYAKSLLENGGEYYIQNDIRKKVGLAKDEHVFVNIEEGETVFYSYTASDKPGVWGSVNKLSDSKAKTLIQSNDKLEKTYNDKKGIVEEFDALGNNLGYDFTNEASMATFKKKYEEVKEEKEMGILLSKIPTGKKEFIRSNQDNTSIVDGKLFLRGSIVLSKDDLKRAFGSSDIDKTLQSLYDRGYIEPKNTAEDITNATQIIVHSNIAPKLSKSNMVKWAKDVYTIGNRGEYNTNTANKIYNFYHGSTYAPMSGGYTSKKRLSLKEDPYDLLNILRGK